MDFITEQKNMSITILNNIDFNMDVDSKEDSLEGEINTIEPTGKTELNSGVGSEHLSEELHVESKDYDSDGSYRSSDFEFITEEEAEKEPSFICNWKKSKKQNYFDYANMNNHKWRFKPKTCETPRMDIGRDLMQEILLRHKVENSSLDMQTYNEAEDTKRKILEMYPVHNKTRQSQRSLQTRSKVLYIEKK